MTREEKAVQQFMQRENLPFAAACGCMGPMRGEPLCPCAMEYTEVVDGALFRVTWEKGGFVANLVKENYQ